MNTSNLNIREIPLGIDWALFVAFNRGRLTKETAPKLYEKYTHYTENVDVFTGFIANDRMFVVLDRFFDGDITDRALVESLSALKLGIQYVAITQKACDAIKILSENEINYYQPNSPFPFINNNFSHKMKPIEFEGGNIYEGEWNENFVMDGHGKYFLLEEKVLAEGIWEKGELKKARIFYPNGEFYEGEMNNSCYNGKGKLINENKDIYEGEFLDGEKNGKGKINFFNGDIYEGDFSKNKFHGYGELSLENGLKYKGNFFSNFLEGKGVLSFPPQEKYEGDFEKNLFHGKGVYTYSNGDEYYGGFEFGIRKGKGTYKQKDGITFEGNWENNVPNGAGKIFFNDKIIKCNYHNGKIMDKPVDEDGLYYNNIDYNFYCEKMNLLGKSIPYLENSEENNDYRPGTILSFLEDDE